MGSYCQIKFDDLEVMSAKSAIPHSFISLFQESDRFREKTFDDEDEGYEIIGYRASRARVLLRLDIMGITTDAVRSEFYAWIENEIKNLDDVYLDTSEISEILHNMTYESWKERVPQALLYRYSYTFDDEEALDVISKRMTFRDSSWLNFDVPDERYLLRAFLEACETVEFVILELSDLISGGWLSDNEKICTYAKAFALDIRPVIEKTMIMAEGSSDISVLKLSILALYPEVSEYFSFFDHDGLAVDGGASYLVKFLKAFAAAQTAIRVIALFDNDVEGNRSFDLVEKLNLPKNIRAIVLPHNELAENYPTVGPQGQHLVDVNGLACSIELYLGREVISDAGALRSVRWTSYNPTTRKYQGEIEGKIEVQKKFDQIIKNYDDPDIAKHNHPELASVWALIFRTAKKM